MREETIDFFVHEINKHLAAWTGQNLIDHIERRAGPTKWVNEGEARDQSPVAQKTRIALSEGSLEFYAAIHDHRKIRRQVSQRYLSAKVLGAVLSLFDKKKMHFRRERRFKVECGIKSNDRRSRFSTFVFPGPANPSMYN